MTLQISRESTSLRNQVTNRLRDAILSGTFKPGQKLVEKDLCNQLGISRTIIRESLQHLGAEGLILNIPHKGPTVATISYSEAKGIYDVRQALESLAGEGFAKCATDQQVQQLRQVLNELKQLAEDKNYERILETKNKFYEIIFSGCGNPVLGSLLTLLNNRVTLLRRVSLSGKSRLPDTLAELSGIVSAIEARDPALAGLLCRSHVASAALTALRNLQDQQTNPLAEPLSNARE
jgi:DNA-binding GntR family transcriptional regulator